MISTVDFDPKFAHKTNEKNVLIKDLFCKDEKKDLYQSSLIIDTSHTFFYDYPFEIDHVPGIVIIEATKQMACVVAHEYWKIPLEYAFAPIKANSKFIRFVELNMETILLSKLTYKKLFKGIFLAKMSSEIFQDNNKLGLLNSDFVFIIPDMYKKIRKGMETEKFGKMMDLIRKL